MDDFMTEYQSDEFTPAEFAPFDFEDEDDTPYSPHRAEWLDGVILVHPDQS